MRLLSLFVLLFLLGCSEGCTPAVNAPQSANPVTIGAVSASGTCDARLSVGLTVGPLHLPLTLDAATLAAADGQTQGSVHIDLGGWLRATCLIISEFADGSCTITGPLAPRAAPPSPDVQP